MKFLSLIIILVIPHLSLSQNQGNIWYFGNQAGIDFNTNPPSFLLDGQTDFNGTLGWNEGCTSISDSDGSLLFYSNGEKVWNQQHQIMQNGDNLMGHSSATSSSIIVPFINSDQYFYLFTVDAWENSFQNGLRYSVIDICLDNGNGGVLQGQKNISLYDNVAEKLCVVRHSNESDYWLISHAFNSADYISFRITSSEILGPFISTTESIDPQGWGGQMVASPNGLNIAYAIPSAVSFGKTFLLDFDANTGLVSNERILSIGGREWGVSFSADNTKLYFSTAGFGELFQYDLTAGSFTEIIDSKTYLIQDGPDSWRHHRLGPDGKIYISRTNKNHLSMIEFPDINGIDCNYVDSAIYLGGRFTSFGLPDFIAGYEYQNTTFNCVTGVNENNANINYSIYPNPVSQMATLTFDNSANDQCIFSLFNSKGQLVKTIPSIITNEVRINKGELISGLYFFHLRSNDKINITGKIIFK